MSSTIKSFYYQNNLYPFNFDLFKTTSEFISKNENQLLSEPYINLVDDFFTIPELTTENIYTFISFCQHENYQLKPTNISSLYSLSNLYEVGTLKEEIQRFIPEHYHEIIDEYFNSKESMSEMQEEILSEHLDEFVEDRRLFQIPVHNLYRIITQYYHKYRLIKSNYKDKEEKIVNFIFEGLDQIGIESILLFDQITFENCSIKFINEKLRKYSFICNLDNSITPKFIQALSEMSFKIKENDDQMNKEIKALKKENEKQNEINKTLTNSLSALFLISKFNLSTKNIFTQKASELLIYLSKYDTWNNPPIFVPNENDNLYETFGKKRKNDPNKIGLYSSTVDSLYITGLLNSDAFIEHINQFTEIILELRYSSQFFDSLLVIFPEVKKLISSKTKLTIELRIDENSTKNIKDNQEQIDSIKIGPNVTVIEKNSFSNFSSIKEISIPSNVTRIEESSFEGCTALKEIQLPITLTSLGSCVFCECKSLTKITIPSSIRTINKKAFYGCSSLTQVDLSKEIYYILDSAFEGCTSLKQISIPSRLIELGTRSFYGCSSLTQISLPPTVIIVGEDSFKSCTSLTQIKIPSTVSKVIYEMNLKSKIITESVSPNEIFDYGVDLFLGRGVSIDKEGVSKYYKKASDLGNMRAAYNYAVMLHIGEGIPINKEEAIKYYKMAIDNGHSGAMNNYATMLKNGNGILVNKEEAIKYYKMAIDKGDGVAMKNYALMLHWGDGIPVNKKEAIKYYKMAIDKGNGGAMNNYAYMLQYGEGISMNKEEAIRHYKMAVDVEFVPAFSNYGYMLYHGEGTPTNKKEALKYYKEAADKDDLNGIYNYASMLYEGDTVEKNYVESFIYFKKAADKGHSNSMNNCGFMLEHGQGVPANKEESIKYYKLAIDQGNVVSLYNYSCMTQNDTELKHEEESAMKYYTQGLGNDNIYEINNHHLLIKLDEEINIEKATKYYTMFKEQMKTRSIQDLEQLIQNQ